MKLKRILLFLFIQIGLHSIAQSELGINAGLNHSGFYQFNSKNRGTVENIQYRHHIGYTTSAYYKEQVSSKTFAGFEIENIQIRSNLALVPVSTHTTHSSYSALFNMNYLNLHVLYGGKVTLKKMELVFEGSPYFGCMIYSKAKGNGVYSKLGSYIDSLGYQLPYWSQVPFEVENAKAFINRVNVGLRVNVRAVVPINTKWSASLNATYHFGIYNVSTGIEFLGIRGYGISAGLVRKLEKSYLRMSKWKST